MIPRQPFISEAEIVQTIKGILEAIRSPEHADDIIELQKVYKKHVPLFDRSYFATFLLKEALNRGGLPLGHERNEKKGIDHGNHKGKGRDAQNDRPQRNDKQGKDPGRRLETQKQGQKQGQSKELRDKESKADQRLEDNRTSQPRNLPLPEGVEASTLFVSAGRKRHFYPRHFLDLLDENGISRDSVGEIRLFDNYTFVQVRAEAATEIIEKLDGSSFKGRRLTVNPARKREESGSVIREDSNLGDRADVDASMAPSSANDSQASDQPLGDAESPFSNDTAIDEPIENGENEEDDFRPAGLGTGGYETDYASDPEDEGDWASDDEESSTEGDEDSPR